MRLEVRLVKKGTRRILTQEKLNRSSRPMYSFSERRAKQRKSHKLTHVTPPSDSYYRLQRQLLPSFTVAYSIHRPDGMGQANSND